MDFDRRAAILAAFLGARISGGCMVVDDPDHCANRDGDATCAELYGAGVYCDACDHFHNGCVEVQPEPECRDDDDEESSESDESSDEGAALECDGCPQDDAGEAVR